MPLNWFCVRLHKGSKDASTASSSGNVVFDDLIAYTGASYVVLEAFTNAQDERSM